MGPIRFWKRKKQDVEDARKEREHSAQRLKSAQALAAHIDQIREENHFAEAIIDSIIRGHEGT